MSEDRPAATAAAHQALTRAMRTYGERAVGTLLEAIKRCPDHQSQIAMKAAVDLIREAHALDAEDMKDWRPKGGV